MARSSDPWLAFPMFLLVTGSELHKDSCRTDLWSMLNAAAAGTVRRGIQHFWITWFVPTTVEPLFSTSQFEKVPGELRTLSSAGVARWTA